MIFFFFCISSNHNFSNGPEHKERLGREVIGTRQGGVFISPVSFAFANSLGQTIVGSDRV